jgi:hypothetical protein
MWMWFGVSFPIPSLFETEFSNSNGTFVFVRVLLWRGPPMWGDRWCIWTGFETGPDEIYEVRQSISRKSATWSWVVNSWTQACFNMFQLGIYMSYRRNEPFVPEQHVSAVYCWRENEWQESGATDKHQLVPYGAVNRNKVSIRQLPLLLSFSLYVSVPTGHLQVRCTTRYS